MGNQGNIRRFNRSQVASRKTTGFPAWAIGLKAGWSVPTAISRICCRGNRLLALGVAFTAAIICSSPAKAANDAWSTAPSSSNFADPNWTTGTTTPGAATGSIATGDVLYFGTSSALTLDDNEAAGFNIGGFTFNSGANAFTITDTTPFSHNLTGNIVNNSTTGQTINDVLALTATRTVTATSAAGGVTLGGALSGSGSLIATGPGTVTITNANNTYAGTTIGAAASLTGVVRAAATQALGSGTISYDGTGGATSLRLELINGISLNNAITLAGRSGTAISIENISGSNTLSGIITGVAGGNNYNFQSDAGTLTLGTAGATAFTTASAGRLLTFTGAGNVSVVGNILQTGAGSAALTMSGAGTLTLSGANTYTGLTTISAGTLKEGANNSINSGNAVTVSSNAATVTPIFDLAGFNQTVGLLTLGGSSTTGGASVTNSSGSSVLTVSGGVTYSATNNPLGATISVTTLGLNNAIQTFTIGDSTTAVADTTVSSVIQNGGITKAGAGTLVLSGANTYAGATAINVGTLQFSKTNAMSASSAVSVASGATLTVNAGGTSEFTTGSGNGTIGGLFAGLGGQSGSTVTYASGALIGVDTTNAAATVTESTNLTATGVGLTKLGTGTLALAGTNSYTGTTTISVGTLQFNGAAAMSSGSALTLATGATLALRSDSSASFTPASITSLAGAGTFNFDVNNLASGVGRTLALTGAITQAGTATYNVTGGNNYTLALGAISETGGAATTTFNANTAGVTLSIASYATTGNNNDTLIFTGSGNTTVGAVTAFGTHNSNAGRFNVFTFNQSATVTLTADDTNAVNKNNLAGTITNAINNGTLVLDNNNALPVTVGTTVVAYTLGSNTSTSNNVNLLLGDANNLAGGLTVARSFAVQDLDSGTITVGGQNSSGTNTYSGNLTLGATANTGKSVNLAAAAGGTATFSGVIAKNGTDTSAGVTINGSYSVNGSTVNPAGTVLLSNANTYAGGTTVSAGTLKTTGATANLGVGNVSVGAGATLELDNAVSISDSGTLTFTNSSSIFLSATIANSSESVFAITDATTGITLSTPGTYTVAQLNSGIYFGGAINVFSNTGTAETITVVPEPASLGLLGLTLSGLLVRRRRVIA